MRPRCYDCFFVVPPPLYYFVHGFPIHRKCLADRIVRESIAKIWRER